LSILLQAKLAGCAADLVATWLAAAAGLPGLAAAAALMMMTQQQWQTVRDSYLAGVAAVASTAHVADTPH
jgi:uncharacterized protein YceK